MENMEDNKSIYDDLREVTSKKMLLYGFAAGIVVLIGVWVLNMFINGFKPHAGLYMSGLILGQAIGYYLVSFRVWRIIRKYESADQEEKL